MRMLSQPHTSRLTRQPPQKPCRRNAVGPESGFTLVELLVTVLMFLLVVGAVTTVLVSATKVQARDQSYATEVQTSQAALARLIHDLRDADSPVTVSPGRIDFKLMVDNANGTTTTWNVEYNCNAPDTLGSPYTRCARTQAVAPNPPPTYSSILPGGIGSDDIQHVWNNPTNTSDLGSGNDYTAFCKTDGSAPSGSVFLAQNSNTANSDGSTAACDQTYQAIVAAAPDYVKVRIQVPAGGDQARNGLKHFIVLSDGTYLPNLDQSQ